MQGDTEKQDTKGPVAKESVQGAKEEQKFPLLDHYQLVKFGRVVGYGNQEKDKNKDIELLDKMIERQMYSTEW